jgi:hypothetical protein
MDGTVRPGRGDEAHALVGVFYAVGMSITLDVPADVMARFERAAAQCGISAADLAAEVLAEHAPSTEPVRRRQLGFVGAGASGDARPTDIHRLRLLA